MKFNYQVTPISINTLHELPNDWTLTDYRALLDLTDNDSADIPDAEVKEMTFMALSDLEKPEAAQLVLEYLAGEILSKGQIQNAAHEMEDEKLWDEFADVSMHRTFFSTGSLLYQAFNGGFPRPEAMEIKVSVTPKKESDKKALQEMDASFLLRLLAPGLDSHALIQRLFDEQLAGTSFPEAEHIIWQKNLSRANLDGSFILSLISSKNWFEDFAPAETYACTIWPDAVLEEEED